MNRKFMAMLLALVMVISMVPMAAMATENADCLVYGCSPDVTFVEGTCKTEGKMISTCQRCGKVTETSTGFGGHNMIVGALVEPTCTTPGSKLMMCANGCGYETTETLTNPDAHNMVVGALVEPTCTTPGSKVMMCANGCGHETTEELAVDADAHNMIVGALVEPTCTLKGSKVWMCANGCGHETTEELAALKHNMVLVETKNATYLADGYNVYACAHGCGETYTEVLPKLIAPSTDGYDYVPRTGSAFVEWLYALIFG